MTSLAAPDRREATRTHASAAALSDWLIRQGRFLASNNELFAEFCERVAAAGIPVDRAALHLRALHPQVKKDYDEIKRFFSKYENPIQPFITWIYGKYLKANNQPAGKRTYSEVIAFLISYQRKFGKESL